MLNMSLNGSDHRDFNIFEVGGGGSSEHSIGDRWFLKMPPSVNSLRLNIHGLTKVPVILLRGES